MKRLRLHLVAALRRFLNRWDRTIVPTMTNLGRPRHIDVLENTTMSEYIRLSTLELCADEIMRQNVPGAMAEVGVYQGHFASKLNALFPDRELYLFDTFSGFNLTQLKADCISFGRAENIDFSDTSVKQVLHKMSHPGRCLVFKGLFPQTAEGLEAVFALVSLDADLHDPIYAGLCYFWPRLAKGGYILVHDYNNAIYPGAKAAVIRFAHEQKTSFVPVTDFSGTVIFVK